MKSLIATLMALSSFSVLACSGIQEGSYVLVNWDEGEPELAVLQRTEVKQKPVETVVDGVIRTELKDYEVAHVTISGANNNLRVAQAKKVFPKTRDYTIRAKDKVQLRWDTGDADVVKVIFVTETGRVGYKTSSSPRDYKQYDEMRRTVDCRKIERIVDVFQK